MPRLKIARTTWKSRTVRDASVSPTETIPHLPAVNLHDKKMAFRFGTAWGPECRMNLESLFLGLRTRTSGIMRLFFYQAISLACIIVGENSFGDDILRDDDDR